MCQGPTTGLAVSGDRGAIGWQSDGDRLAIGWQSAGNRMALGWPLAWQREVTGDRRTSRAMAPGTQPPKSLVGRRPPRFAARAPAYARSGAIVTARSQARNAWSDGRGRWRRGRGRWRRGAVQGPQQLSHHALVLFERRFGLGGTRGGGGLLGGAVAQSRLQRSDELRLGDRTGDRTGVRVSSCEFV